MDASQLVQRYVPVVRYDSNEAFFADSAAEMVGNPAVRLMRDADGDAEVIASSGLDLDYLGGERYADGKEVKAGDHLSDQRRDYREQSSELHMHADLRNVVYGRSQADSHGVLWLQYWFFYLYNDAGFGGRFGLHEGDWEMVQLRLDDTGAPDLALYAQHTYAESRTWDAVEQDQNGAPIVYPGRGTHASYFEPGLHKTEAFWDIADGRREAPPLTLVTLADPLPGWVLWPGRWGDTRPRIPLIDSWSPTGPAQHSQWDDPLKLSAKAHGHEQREPQPAPSVRVRRTRGRLGVRFDFAGPTEGPAAPDRLVITVNSREEATPPETYTFALDEALTGWLLTRRVLDNERAYDVHTSVVAEDGTPSAAERTDLKALSTVGRLLSYVRSTLADLRGALRREI